MIMFSNFLWNNHFFIVASEYPRKYLLNYHFIVRKWQHPETVQILVQKWPEDTQIILKH